MEVIDEGGFGCIIKPALKCKNQKSHKSNMISKLQLSKYSDYEMRQILKIKNMCKKIPNCNNYSIIEATSCVPIIPKNMKNKTRCALLEEKLVSSYLSSTKGKSLKTLKPKKGKTGLKAITLPYKGVNLHVHILNNVDYSNTASFIEINNSIIDLYQNFIMILNKNNFYHNDIKTLNILVDNDHKYRLIDWGIANKIIFTHTFIFNKPYMYILLSNYFLDKIDDLKKKGDLKYENVKKLIINYLELIKIKTDSNYIYTKEILEFLFPNIAGTKEAINPILLECFIQISLRFESSKKWVEIYMNNLDITSVAIMYADILCAMAMKKQLHLNLQQGIISFYNKYVIECYTIINPDDFITDLNKLNLLVV
jgi:serine/threonine protein kinase